MTEFYFPRDGALPQELEGRELFLKQADIVLRRIQAGRAERSLLLVGMREAVRTALLNEMEKRAEARGFHTIFIEAQEEKSLALVASYLCELLMNDITMCADINPEPGSADSGDIEIDLPQLFMATGEAAKDRRCAVAIFIDKMQDLSRKELSALIMAMHRMQQKQFPITLVGTGPPMLSRVIGETKFYAEHLFHFLNVDTFSQSSHN
jgi:hypothetical protein